MVDRRRLAALLDRIGSARVVVAGDFAVDGYWEADMTRSELSRETPHYCKPILAERYSLGAAGNVAANLADLGCGRVEAVTVIGDDWRGRLMRDLFAVRRIGTGGVITAVGRFTAAYIKPLLKGYESVTEDARLDFENAGRPAPADAARFIAALAAAAAGADAVLLCDQFGRGVFGDVVVKACVALARRGPAVFIADSRYRVGAFRGMVLKPNEIEACRAAGVEWRGAASLRRAGAILARRGAGVFITVGPDGVRHFGRENFH
ncbi:MAG: hypothetical protein ABIF71_09515 [Planctomycetota bacterium]